jgi:hypothetical protein
MVIGGACGSPGDVTAGDDGLRRIERAIEVARDSNSYRVRGLLSVGRPLVRWEGIVVGGDEQYIISTYGLLIDSRRIDSESWARRLDTAGPWMQVPPDPPINLAVLLRGSDVHTQHPGDEWRIELRFDIDVLDALAHIPSTGPSTAVVTLREGLIADVTLQISGDVNARISFWDYGAPLAVEPVDPSASTGVSGSEGRQPSAK